MPTDHTAELRSLAVALGADPFDLARRLAEMGGEEGRAIFLDLLRIMASR